MKSTLLITPIVGLLFLMGSCDKNEISAIPAVTEPSVTQKIFTIEDGAYFNELLRNTPRPEIAEDRAAADEQPIYTNDHASDLVNPTGSKLRRHANSINISYLAEDSPNLDVSGHAATLWALVWHSPGDAFSGLPPYAMYRMAGKVVGGTNKFNISGVLHEGQEDDYYPTGPGTMTFQDAESDFIVFIGKSHGPKDPAEMPGQILTFGGGCDDDPDGGGPLSPCSEWIYSIHF